MELFSSNVSVEQEELVLAGVRATELARRFGTPALVIDEGALRARARAFRDGLSARWSDSRVLWASKSLPHTALYRVMAEEGLGVDVAGGGELVMALAGGVEPALIVLHGNAKTDAEIQMALDAGVGTIVIDNLDDVARLEHRATSAVDVLIRVLPGVETDTYDALSTGHRYSKFGLAVDEVAALLERLAGSRHLRVQGLHVHVGSQICDLQPFERAVEALAPLGEFPRYDLGGGLGARYVHADQPPSVEAYLDALTGAARRLLPSSAQLLIEPGRSMVAEAAFTLYRVVTVKQGPRGPLVAVDGGMGDNLEVSLYGQPFDATLANRVGRGPSSTLVGRHCESGDQLIESVGLRSPVVGDLVAVPVTGAYCFTMANNYNGALRPPIVMVADGEAREVLARETYEDLTRRDR